MLPADESPCIDCGGGPRLPGGARCRKCKQAYERTQYARRQAGAGRFRLRWSQFLVALCLEAAYASGYRQGVGDRAAQLVGARYRAREAERERRLMWEERRRLTG